MYWSTLKTFLNKKKLYSIFYTMANLSRTLRKRLNSLVASLQGSDLLLITTGNFCPFLIKKHVSYFWQLSFQHDILKIISYLNPNKAHGHNIISIWMLKICDESICKPVGIICWSCLQNGKLPSEWKETNVVSAFKKKK